MDVYQSYIHRSRYARFLPEKNRRENWGETVDRYMKFMTAHLEKNHNYKIPQEMYKEIRAAIFNLEVMPSMRALMTAGKAAERDNTCIYNCAYLPVDDAKSFDEAMFILLCGTGVGFSVERQYVNKLPEIPDEMFQSDTTIVVKDSKEGWAKALRQLIALLYSGEIPKWDLSKLRPAGAPLKTFGGRASGPAPLDELFKFCVRIFSNAKGRKLTSLECHDVMCKIAEVVVVGGVRRSAMISLSNLSDDRMRHAKSGAWWEANVQRALSNNSAVYTEKPDVGVFMQEWLSLYESKSGERGIFSRDAARRVVMKNGRRDPNHEWGCNPCCFTGTMKLLTTDGYKTFEELEGKEFKIINPSGQKSVGKVWKVNRRKDVARIVFHNHDAPSIEATYDHIFKLANGEECQAKDLIGKRPKRYVKMKTSPDAYHENDFHAGFMLGDGILTDLLNDAKKGLTICIGQKDHDVLKYLGGHSVDALDKNGHLYTQHNAWVAREFRLPAKKIGERGLPESVRTKNGLMGLYSANGSVIRQSRIALKTTDFEQANDLVSTLADLFGIVAYITTNKAKENEFGNGVYEMKESYDVNIGRYFDIIKFAEEIGFVQKYKQEALQVMIDARAPVVKSLENIGEHDIYDFNEPETNWGVVNGVVVHNSEIILRPYEFCNLSEVVVRATDTEADLLRKTRIAAIIGTFQSTFTYFPYLRKIWTKNVEEERLLGVSLTGIYDSKLMNDYKDKTLPDRLQKLRDLTIQTNKELAEELGIPQSAAVTCTKPSGTVSELVDAASGIHPRHDPYYFRRVRADNKDPLTKHMIAAGVVHEPDVTKPESTTVFTFSKKAPEGAVMRSDISAIDHLSLWLMYQRHWCEHKPSVTISVTENEWPSVGAWVWEHFDELSGVSFLPFDGGTYRQAPYETINQDQYEELLKKTPTSIDWDNLTEMEDNVEGTQTLACTAGGCTI